MQRFLESSGCRLSGPRRTGGVARERRRSIVSVQAACQVAGAEI